MMRYPVLAQVEDVELRERIRKVLCKMELLSEARAKATERRTPSGDPDHLPPEIQKRPRTDGKPPRERSLFERYLWEFECCPTRRDPQWAFRLLCAHAERDLEHHLKGAPTSAIAGSATLISGEQTRSGAQVEEEEGDALVADYEGAPAGEVAAILQVHVAWVQKAREHRGRNPESGLPKPGWPGWSEEERFDRVQGCKARRLSQRETADELKTSKTNVQRRWERMPDQKAA